MPSPPTRHWFPAALIFLVCAAAYFLARTPALDEWDSVQFALGVGDFNLSRHQPHPPGYPLYIAAGWLAHRLLPLDVPNALQLVSALGGGLFVACWFVLVARRFGRVTAWWFAASLATLLVTWMSATKVLTDPAAVGWLTLTLLLADTSRRCEGQAAAALAVPPDGWLAAAAAAGAVAVGVRPQNVGVVLLIVVLTMVAVRRPFMRRRWKTGLGVFLGVGLLWLLPTMLLQAETPESHGNWLAYPQLLLAQWRWRLDQPKAFIGAEVPPGAESLWLYRADHHFFGLLTRGFGFSPVSVWGWMGAFVLVAGWVFYALRGRVRWLSGSLSADDGGDARGFWTQHLPWAVVYYLTIFCFLPGDQRYYLPIFPLLILPAVLGWQSLRPSGWQERGRWLAVLVPAATLLATLPFIGPNHTEEAPPVRMIRWLEAQYSIKQRPHVYLFLRDSYRHAGWYDPNFPLLPAEYFYSKTGTIMPYSHDPNAAFYTDDPAFVAKFPSPGWRLVQTFQRSPLIYRKHNTVELYRLSVGGQ